MEELVEAIVRMHGQRVYNSAADVITEKWPWLLRYNASDLHLIDTDYSFISPDVSGGKQNVLSLRASTNNTGTDTIVLVKKPSTLKLKNPFSTASLSNKPSFEDDACSAMGFESSNEDHFMIGLYSTYFPYPTQRTILKETQRILKTTLYEFTKIYVPEKLYCKAYEYSASSSLSQWVLMVQDVISKPEVYKDRLETYSKLSYLHSLSSSMLDCASEVYDLISQRQHVSTSELYVLLANVLELIDAFGIPECSAKHRVLKGYTSALATDLKKKLEEVQLPLRNTMRRIVDERERLLLEEDSASQKYREEEKAIQRDFLLEPEILKSILQPEDIPKKVSKVSKTITLEHYLPIGRCTNSGIYNEKTGAFVNLPDICVWGPDKELIDYRPGGNGLIESIKDISTRVLRLPWNSASIDLAIDAINAKENTLLEARDAYSETNSSKIPSLSGRRLGGPRFAASIAILPKLSKAIPIKKAEKMSSDNSRAAEADLIMS
ncbi:hypothetical protein ABW20_dc0103400 [Dactylellina cionopaga]|nr:hypothetical protein ABW20_dc0103400 [Dactylellina cionopaga]